MVDCHMHMVLDGVEWKSAIGRHAESVDMGFVRAVLAQYQQKGSFCHEQVKALLEKGIDVTVVVPLTF